MRKSIRAFTILLALAVAGCAIGPGSGTFDPIAFRKGDSILDCMGFTCALRWRLRSASLKELYNQESWEALAQEVAELGYASDLAFFYLGSSAQGLGARTAARRYYERTATTSVRCGSGGLNSCAGIDIASEVRAKLTAEEHERLARSMSIREAQSILAQLGLYTAGVDGIAGPGTRRAVTQFQQAEGLNTDGQLSFETKLRLVGKSPPAETVVDTRPVRVSYPAEIRQAEAETELEETAIEDKPTLATTSPARTSIPDPDPDPDPDPETIAVNARQEESPVPEFEESLSLTSLEESPATADVGGNTPAPTQVASIPSPATAPETPEKQQSRVRVQVELLAEADPFASVVRVVESGTLVTVDDRGQEWSQVSLDSDSGFVYTDVLE